jgi:hypothetical protein
MTGRKEAYLLRGKIQMDDGHLSGELSGSYSIPSLREAFGNGEGFANGGSPLSGAVPRLRG